MNFEYFLLIFFVIIISLFLYFERKKLVFHGKFPLIYFCMYKTKLGLKWMNTFSKKWSRILPFTLWVGIITGFLGMLLISYDLIRVTIQVLTTTTKIIAVTPVLPFKAKGVFYVPFSYWIISIFIIALIHEFSHGIASRVHNIPVKSSGFAFLGIIVPIIPAAFVEPDENLIRNKKLSEKLGVFAAGPFSNIAFALLLLLIVLFVFKPLSERVAYEDGVLISSVLPNTPASKVGLSENEVLKSINGEKFKNVKEFVKVLNKTSPGQEITLTTDKKTYTLILGEHSEKSQKSFIGVTPVQYYTPKINSKLYAVFKWFSLLIETLFLLNLGIGLFNLLPIGPLDGGRMFHAVLENYLSKKKALKIFSVTSALFLFIISFHLLNTFLS